MNKKHLGIVAGTLASAAIVSSTQGQAVDSLLDKLVQKGILTQQEAEQLREQADNDFTKAYQVKSGLPDWVTTLKIGGDFRGRYEMFQSENERFLDRHRFRYRLRAGAVATMLENFEVGFRLTSSEQQGGFGGDPISGNSTLQDNASKKFVFIDLAYARWSPVINDMMRNSVTVGKMENPFVFSDMVFDGDYTPEGIGNSFIFTPNDQSTLRFNVGAFSLDELGSSSQDPYLLGAQVRWDAKWSPKLETTMGVAGLAIHNSGSLINGNVPNINAGNTRESTNVLGELTYHFNPIIADAGITFNLEEFPLPGFYPGPFPIRVAGEVMHNPAAPTRNSGWTAGLFFGKSGKKRTWDLSYRYKFLEADAWYEEFTDSDFGAFYPGTPGSFALGSGYRAGTNVKGHILRASYSPAHSLTFGVTYFLVELLQEDQFATGTLDDDTKTGRLQVDALWKF